MSKEFLTGILYGNQKETGNAKVYYSFGNSTGAYIFNDLFPSGDQVDSSNSVTSELYPGLSMGSTNNPISYTGTPTGSSKKGYFNQTDLVKLSKPFGFNNWTLFLNYKGHNPNPSKKSVLLSTMDTPTGLSGFSLSLDSSNFFNFEFQDSNGIKHTNSHHFELGEKTLISVSKLDDKLEIVSFDPTKAYKRGEQMTFFSTSVSQFNISGYKASNDWYIGGYPSSHGETSHTGFSGFIDDFVLFDGAFPTKEKEWIADSFFVSGYQSGLYSGSGVYQNKVTGTIVNPTGVTGSGITGYNSVLSGSANLSDGTVANVYQQIPLYGALTGTVTTYLTGSVLSGTVPVFLPEEKTFNNPIVSGYSKNNIRFLKNVPTSASAEIYSYFNPFTTTGLSMTANYDLGKTGFTTDTGYVSGNLNLYVNGSAQCSGVDFTIKDTGLKEGFLSGIVPVISFTDKNINTKDTVLYDKVANYGGGQISYDFTGYNTTLQISGAKYVNKDIYLNGKKLISGINYSGFSSYVDLYASGLTSGKMCFLPRRSDIFNRFVGSQSGYYSVGFGLIAEQVWLEGLRQKYDGLTGDYVDVSSSSNLSSGNFLPSLDSKLYVLSGENNFFDI